MPIKYLQFSFAVPMTQLLGLIATGDVGVKIDAVEDIKALKKQLNGGQPKLLEGPKKPHGNSQKTGSRQRGKDQHGNPVTAYETILRAMAAKPDHTETLQELRPMIEGLGLAPSSANSQISLLVSRKFASRTGEGIYRLTAAGLRECVRRGLKVGGPKEGVKKKKPVKKAKPEIEQEVKEEAVNGEG